MLLPGLLLHSLIGSRWSVSLLLSQIQWNLWKLWSSTLLLELVGKIDERLPKRRRVVFALCFFSVSLNPWTDGVAETLILDLKLIVELPIYASLKLKSLFY